MIIGKRVFVPTAWSIVLTAAGVALFVSLGLWQLERADYKTGLERKFERRLAQDYRPLDSDEDFSDIQYRKLRLKGRYDLDHQFLLDNQVHEGRAGYHVLTPFRLADSDFLLLVDRGWAAWGERRSPLPPIRPPLQAGTTSGIAFVPGEPALKLGEPMPGGDWPRLITYIDIDELRQYFADDLLPMVLWMSPETPGVYLRDWDPVWLPPEKSRAYALQWFSFAAISLLLFVLLNLRKIE
ncbi:MAG TPA: SURF1 family protein [Gammaproteobacteria bacterium]|jgi:surfeit locus 1 family protein